MVANDVKMLSTFTKFLDNINQTTKTQIKSNGELVILAKKQLEEMKKLIEVTIDINSGGKSKTIVRQSKTQPKENKIDKKAEKVQEKKEKKTKKAAKESAEQITEFAEASEKLKDSGRYIKDLFGLPSVFGVFDSFIGNIKGEFIGLTTLATKLFFNPIKAVGSGLMGIGKGILGGTGLKQQESKEAIQEKQSEQTSEIIDVLKDIDKNTSPDKEMFKMPNFMDKLKGLIPGIGGAALGGKAMKMVGGALILGGVAWFISDFVDGFKEGGIKGGLSKMLLGKLDGTVGSAMKNAGKYALIGAGIGTFVAPVIGTIAGGLIGGAIGLLLNTVGSMFTTKGDLGSKLKGFFLGGNGGVMSSLFTGAKYAAIGAIAGTVFAPGIGTIVGGLIGFAIGFLINFVKQMLPKNIKEGMIKIFNKLSGYVKRAWDWAGNKFSALGKWISENIGGWIDGAKTIINKLSGYVKRAWDWAGNKFSALGKWIYDNINVKEYIITFKNKIVAGWNLIKTAVSDFFTNIVDGIGNFFKNAWSNIKSWFGGDSDKEKIIKNGKPDKSKNTKLVEKSGILKDVNEKIEMHLATISEYIQGDMLDNFNTIILNGLEKLFSSMRGLAMEKRMFDFMQEKGSLKGFVGEQSKFGSELKKLGSGGNYGSKREMINAQNNINTANNSNVTIFNQQSKKLRYEAK